MSTIGIALRSLNGGLRHIEVESSTDISALKSKVGARPQSPFHEVRLLHGNGDARVLSGTISDAGLEPGAEVTIVQVVNVDRAIEVFSDFFVRPLIHDKVIRKYGLAIKLLGEVDELTEKQEEQLLILVERAHESFGWTSLTSTLMSIGQIVGRTCRRPKEVVTRVSPLLDRESTGMCKGIGILNVLDAVCRRDKQALTEENMMALVESFTRRAKNDCRWWLHGGEMQLLSVLSLLRLWGGASALELLKEGDKRKLGTRNDESIRDIILQIEQRLASEAVSTFGPSMEHAGAVIAPSVTEAEAETDPLMEEQRDLQRALVLSKADRPMPISYDDSVVILRLTRCCDEVLHAFREASVLFEARKRVEEAGCSLSPRHARGAFLLVPLADDQLLELGLQLEKYHIVALRSDKPAIDEALRMVPRSIRPKMRDDHRAGEKKEAEFRDGRSSAQGASSTACTEVDSLRPRVQEAAQFQQLHPRIRELMLQNAGISDLSDVTVSAPCGESSFSQPWNPRHYAEK